MGGESDVLSLCSRWAAAAQRHAGALCASSLVVGAHRYRVVRVAGEGGFSTVFHVRRAGGGDFAIKRILCQSPEQLRDAQREMHVHRLLGANAPHCLPLLGSDVRDLGGGRHQVLLLYPLMEEGSLVDLLLREARTGRELGERRVLELFVQVCEAVSALHALQPPLAHRDIKVHNVLLGPRGSALLMDFGSCAKARADLSSRQRRLELQERAARQSSMAYRAPELWEPTGQDGQVVDERSDVWSLGCLLFAMLFGQGYSPFECSFGDGAGARGGGHPADPFGGLGAPLQSRGLPAVRPRDCTYLAVIGSVPFPEHSSRSATLKDLCQWMLAVQPRQRPDIAAVLSRARALRDGDGDGDSSAAASAAARGLAAV
jgi:serine/threonine kinase 16